MDSRCSLTEEFNKQMFILVLGNNSLPETLIAAFVSATHTATTFCVALGLANVATIAADGFVVHSDLQGIVFIGFTTPASHSAGIIIKAY